MPELNNIDHTYPYAKYIKPPEKIGSSPKAKSLGKNVAALGSYVQVLVSGKTKAQDVSPLGNKYFMNTGGTCKDVSGVTQTRYVFINNIPDGTMPFISSGMGVQLTSFEGLVPGLLGNLTYLNPFKIFSAFNKETTCQKIKMPIRDINNTTGEEEQYVCDSDISEYNACWFSDGHNPVSKEKCPSFGDKNKKNKNDKNDNKHDKNKKNKKNDKKNDKKKNDKKNDNKNDKKNDKKKLGMTLQYSPFPNDVIFKTYEYGIYLLGVYLLYRLAVKR